MSVFTAVFTKVNKSVVTRHISVKADHEEVIYYSPTMQCTQVKCNLRVRPCISICNLPSPVFPPERKAWFLFATGRVWSGLGVAKIGNQKEKAASLCFDLSRLFPQSLFQCLISPVLSCQLLKDGLKDAYTKHILQKQSNAAPRSLLGRP